MFTTHMYKYQMPHADAIVNGSDHFIYPYTEFIYFLVMQHTCCQSMDCHLRKNEVIHIHVYQADNIVTTECPR